MADDPSMIVFGSGLLLTSLIFLGTWPALLRLSSTPPTPSSKVPIIRCWCYSFFTCDNDNNHRHHRRDARFAYLDYAFAYVISSSIPLVISLWMMDTTSSLDDDEEDSDGENNNNTVLPQQFPLILFALIGGSLLSMGNISMQWSVTVFGAPLTTVLAIQASLTVTLGTSINYILQPEKTSHPNLLFVGVLVFLIAIVLATRAHLLYGHDQQKKQEKYGLDQKSILGIEMNEEPHASYGSLESTDSLESSTESSSLGKRDSPILIIGRDDNMVSLNQVGNNDYTTSASSPSHSPRMALQVAIFGGCCFGFFSPAFNVAVNDPFHMTATLQTNGSQPYLRPLSVPIANLWFSVAFTIASFLGNIPLMYYPPSKMSSSDIDDNCASPLLLPRVTLTEYVYGCESFSERKLAIYSGLLCGIANLLQFQGGNIVGFATADLVQAYPLVSTIWDIVLFGEYRNAGRTVIFYLTAMYVMYTCGIGFLISSADEG